MNYATIHFLSHLFIIVLVLTCGCFGFGMKSSNDQVPLLLATTTVVTPATTPTMVATTALPTPTQEPFLKALKVKQVFNFSSEKSPSEATVYRYWINITYRLFAPRETNYVTKYPASGNKYLIVFVNTVNRVTARTLPPKISNFFVHYDGNVYYPDPTHVFPRTVKNTDSPPEIMRIREIEFFHKLYGSEYVEDFGYSHGMEQMYLSPGESNGIDGYIIYEVPVSFIPDKTYIEIVVNSQEGGVWKLA